MKIYTDWNCRLLPGFSDQIRRPEDAATALELLHERAGISRFSFLPEWNPSFCPATVFRIRLDTALKALQSLLRFPAVLSASASVALQPQLAEWDDLRRFCLPKTDYLAISVPLVPEDWVESEVARFSRHSPFRILLTNAHLLSVFYPKEVLMRLATLPQIAFQFSFQSLSHPDHDEIIRTLLARHAPILLGSGVNSIEKAYGFDLASDRSEAEKRFYPFEIEEIFYGKRIFRR